MSNEFECKGDKFCKHYGWTREQFDEYNKSRSQTIEKMISRHGEEEGTRRFKEYCERQSYAGCKLEYFIEKYGEVQGKEKYEEINKKKALSYEIFVDKYGVDEGKAKFLEYLNKKQKTNNCSSISLDLFKSVVKKLGKDFNHDIHHAGLNDEHLILTESMQPYFVDFADLTTKRVIEFQGTWWHMFPGIYAPDDYHTQLKKTAKEIWESDEKRKSDIERLGYTVLYVWQHDYVDNPDETVVKCVDFLLGK